ncbi:hypothetical protein NPIL_501401 [Nephila pilipes]|uniref:Uncharacterized protein n=1 Tax=Nephila pilipes TaxID=299642 RepID=A0A8X6UE08_NEPPI|nr:hypothetical protein NPIL_501401 [Nephila pilipes]
MGSKFRDFPDNRFNVIYFSSIEECPLSLFSRFCPEMVQNRYLHLDVRNQVMDFYHDGVVVCVIGCKENTVLKNEAFGNISMMFTFIKSDKNEFCFLPPS